MLTKRLLWMNSILKISNDLLIHVIHSHKNLVIWVGSLHYHTATMGTKRDLEKATHKKGGKDLGTVELSRNNGQEIIIFKKDETGDLEKVMYLIKVISSSQVRLGINAPNNYLILRRELLNTSQEEFFARTNPEQELVLS